MKRVKTILFIYILFLPIFLLFTAVKAAEADISIKFDKPTLQKGYTIKSADNNLIIALPPDCADKEMSLTVRRFDNEYAEPPAGKNLINGLYSFDFKRLGETAGNAEFSKPFTVVLKYDSENDSEKHVYFYNKSLDKWSAVLPEKIAAEQKFIRVKLNIPYAQIAVLEESPRVGVASWYKYKNCMCAASPEYPKGTCLKVTALESGESVTVTVNDFGPDQSVFPDRVIDLDLVAFQEIGNPRLGLTKVKVEKIK